MSVTKSLDGIYLDELLHLRSANDQMGKVVRLMAAKVRDRDLAGMLEDAVDGIENHLAVLERLIEPYVVVDICGEHCEGMAGLVREACEHVIENDIGEDLRVLTAIAQFRRMSHYGISGFGTAKALAEALNRKSDVIWLDQILEDICGADKCAIELARTSVSIQA